MKGFFTTKQVESTTRSNGKILSCASCGGYKNCQTPKMQPTGNFKKKIIIIGTAPEERDDRRGMAFQNANAAFLKRTLAELDVDMFEDCLLTYAYHCYNPKEDFEPSPYEIECCRKTTIQIVKENKPKLVLLLGNSAVFSLIGHRWKKDFNDIEKWRGWQIPDQDFKTWLCPVFDPSQVQEKTEVLTVWKLDLKKALKCLKIPFPVHKEPNIHYQDNLDFIHDLVNSTQVEVTFDYETTGKKPHAKGHKIICCSIAYNEDGVHVFMMPKKRKDQQPFIDFLANKRIGKIAQNMKYEHAWSKEILGVEVQGWIWDTMLATHVLDNRTGITSLKFQTYVQFGIVDYDSEINPYLKSADEKNANSINRIEELIAKPGGKEKLMKYCALDSIFELRLSIMQRKLMINLT